MTEHSNNAPASDSSYTAPADHMTAAAIGKTYEHEFAASDNPDKSAARCDDGKITSEKYASADSQHDSDTPRALQLDFHHPLENFLDRRVFRWILARLSKSDRKGTTALERMLRSFRNPAAPFSHRFRYYPLHKIMQRVISAEAWDGFCGQSKQFGATVRGLNIVAKSIAEFGLTVPQKFSAPLFVVWNFTNKCNLKCKHCYQDSEHDVIDNELTLDEKLQLVDQMGKMHMPMIAISGGEPTLSKDLLPVIKRAASYEMHLSLATNGTTMTLERAAELRDAGLRYVEISLDSVDPARHDAFRGIKGMWEQAVRGARNVVATDGLRLGIAMCVHQGNFHEVRDMIRFAEEDLGAGCFAHFNFIPVGRGLKMVSGDITPQQREELLAILNEKMQAPDGIGIISTAPQLGRVCLAGAVIDGGRVPCSHAGAGSGTKARVVAKYLGGCGAGRCYIAIEPDGNVTPCVYLPHRVMGNVRKKPLQQIFRDSVFWEILNDRKRRLGHCEVCKFGDYCGGCRARADAYFGQLHAGDPGCVFNSKHWDKLVADGVAVVDESQTAEDLEISPQRHGPG
ncbi:MAG: radical SAM protein [Phycisphaerae bacterium]|nr:radical SAM protein [Phycisphaerae bacterium]